MTQTIKNLNLKQKHFLTLADFTKEELMQLIENAILLKQQQAQGRKHSILAGKTLGMIFEKSSTRTRVSFEVGMFQLGGHALFLSRDDIQLGNGETIGDTAQVLSRYVDGIMIRTFAHDIVEELAEHATIPIINGLTDDYHPCQVLADLMTIYEQKKKFAGLKLAFVGDGNNMAHSLMIGGALMGMDVTIASPESYVVKDDIYQIAQEKAAQSGAKIELITDPNEAVKDADIIYTDVWTSMGFEAEEKERIQHFVPYQVNETLVSQAKDDYIFMHCLPAKRGEEVTNDVIDGPNSVVFDEAENRLHAQKAILAAFMS